jgi:L-lactate dehydrogenase complex protein LldG
MNDARTAILDAIRRSLGRSHPQDAVQEDRLEDRFQVPPQHVRPAFQEDPVERFVHKLQAARGSCTRVQRLDRAPGAVASFLEHHKLPRTLVLAPDPLLAQFAWPASIDVFKRTVKDDDPTSLTGAIAGVAETGSLILTLGSHNPMTLALLPENHIVLLRTLQIVRHMEDVWPLARAQGAGMPRSLVFITGPSRTADIEQTLQVGAHGPRRLHVVLVEEQD